ncbi:hypothetical protein CAOG_009342 [Capsaspora owczarzaki ATCC 30864]|uniref:Gamma-interferon-inducible lysosomal thiol reductase n=1 Tax=Capsaspora owczarzaki (strain ATCC 30864) TaxID=595528 RepID=A0A0D2WHW9_CAPO3|nr:hypothetical protein CAOG_009342 [Capsaspora owczarzaki ATCC 30864]
MRSSVALFALVALLGFAAAGASAMPAHKFHHRPVHHNGDADTAAYPLIEITLYMESLCPDCQALIAGDLWNVWNSSISSIMNLTLVPYGNAKESQSGSTWEFTCQHGMYECVGNVLETCAINLLQNSTVWFPFIHCLEGTSAPNAAGPACAAKLGINFDPIDACMTSAQGNAMEHEMALKTAALVPAHTYVPWVTLNGAHCVPCENGHLKQAICGAYTGPKPADC